MFQQFGYSQGARNQRGGKMNQMGNMGHFPPQGMMGGYHNQQPMNFGGERVPFGKMAGNQQFPQQNQFGYPGMAMGQNMQYPANQQQNYGSPGMNQQPPTSKHQLKKQKETS